MKNVIRFRGVKATPKSLEKDLLANAKKLSQDPSLIIPKCSGTECRKCAFAKIEKKLAKVASYKDNEAKLLKLASKGDPLVRSYAGTISLALMGKIPFLSTMPLPVGDVSFAVRGKVDAKTAIGLQHFNDPDLRLLAYFDIARDKGLHIYSTEEGLYCSADGPHPPAEYVEEMLGALPYQMKDLSCRRQSAACLGLLWKSQQKTITICQGCARPDNSLHTLTSRIAAEDPTDDFDPQFQYAAECMKPGCSPCLKDMTAQAAAASAQPYREGKSGDKAFIESSLSALVRMVEEKGGIYVMAGKCYGGDAEAFFKDVKGSEQELGLIKGLVKAKGAGVLSDSDQAGRVISALWPVYSLEMLTLASSEATAKAVAAEMTDAAPTVLLAEARRREAGAAILAGLPRLRLGMVGQLADDLARSFKAEGKEAMLKLADKARVKDHRLKAVAFAFMEAVGEGTSHKWQYSKEEHDFGMHLAPLAKKMLEASGGTYAEALKDLVLQSGASEEVLPA
jgi:hypothetical protein